MQEGNQMWGDPSSALMFGLATGLTPLGLLIAGRIPAAAGLMIGAWLFGVMLSNIICGLVALRRGDALWGSLALFFGTMLAGAGVVSSLLHTGWIMRGMEAQIPLQYEGWAWLSCGIVLFLFLPALAKVSWSIVLSGLAVSLGLLLVGIGYIGGLDSQALVDTMKAGGWLIALYGVYCFYAGFALITNTVYQKGIVPLGGPIVKSAPPQAVAPPADATAG